MGYVAVTGGTQAIKVADKLNKTYRLKHAQQLLQVEEIKKIK